MLKMDKKCVIMIMLLLTCLGIPFAWGKNFALLPSHTLCEQARLDRENAMRSTTSPIFDMPIRKSGLEKCFKWNENIFFSAVISVQHEFQFMEDWYAVQRSVNRERADAACKALGFGIDRGNKTFSQCVKEQERVLMAPYDKSYALAQQRYIEERNAKATALAQRCFAAFMKQLPHFGDIEFPLAYYDDIVNSYPREYIDKNLSSLDTLEKLSVTYGSDIVKSFLKDDCHSEMIWWLYPD